MRPILQATLQSRPSITQTWKAFEHLFRQTQALAGMGGGVKGHPEFGRESGTKCTPVSVMRPSWNLEYHWDVVKAKRLAKDDPSRLVIRKSGQQPRERSAVAGRPDPPQGLPQRRGDTFPDDAEGRKTSPETPRRAGRLNPAELGGGHPRRRDGGRPPP